MLVLIVFQTNARRTILLVNGEAATKWAIAVLEFFSCLICSGKSSYHSRHLLSGTSKWETCDFETNYLRNESDPDNKNTTPNEAYGWMVLHIFCVIVIFIGKLPIFFTSKQ